MYPGYDSTGSPAEEGSDVEDVASVLCNPNPISIKNTPNIVAIKREILPTLGMLNSLS
jgi:hypothetical protein